MDTGSGTRVLVVDDEESVLQTIAAILRREGYDVVAVPGVDDALRRLGESPYDVVLTDLRLEGASGMQIVSELRRRWPESAAIVLTGYASLQSAVDALREGAYDYLVKPCDVEELKATVARAVERGFLARQLRQRLEELDAANAKLQSFNVELQRRVEQATAELNEKLRELAEAKQRIEDAQRQREEFISMIAHELGQPLTMIGGYAQLLGREGVTHEARERARTTIISQTRRLGRLVSDLSDASQLATGRFTINPTTCDLIELIQEQVESAKASAGNHIIRVALPPGPLMAEVDRDRIAQVLSNLLDNAVKYSESGVIRVGLQTEDERALIQVSDDGPGVPVDQLQTIFEPRVRFVAGPSDRPTGSGLGLYIARGIVEAHGGRIWAENSAGPGASFWVSLPLESQSSS